MGIMSSDETQSESYTYESAGVSIAAGNALVKAIGPLVKATARPGADGEIGGFGGFFDPKAAGYKDPLLVAANDGVGTKVKLAIDYDRHDTVGIDLVAMCVNDLIVQGAEPLFFLDYFATGHLENGIAERVIAGIADGCKISGCALIGGETAEMPGMYADGDYDLAGFCVGAVERGEQLTGEKIAPGHVLLLENIPRILPKGAHAKIDASSWDQPGLMAFLQAQGNIEPEEMARTFNCGVGMVLAVTPDNVDGVIADLQKAGETAFTIGTIEAGEKGCTVSGPQGCWSSKADWEATHLG